MSKANNSKQLFLSKDRTIILGSLFLAFIFWAVVKLSKEYRTSNDLKLEWVMADSLTWNKPPPNIIHVNYEGEGWSLLGGHSNKNITFDTEGFGMGQTVLNRREVLSILERHFSSNKKIIDFTPDHFILDVGQRSQVKLPVQAVVKPELNQGLVLKGSAISIPDSVLVSGPSQFLNNLSAVYTNTWSPVIQKVQTVSAKLSLLDSTNILTFSPKEVSLEISVEEVTEKSFFVPIIPLNVKGTVRIFPEQIKISFSLPLSKFDEILPSDFQLVADFDGIKKGNKNNTLPIEIQRQPTDIRNLHFTTKSIEFFIEKE